VKPLLASRGWWSERGSLVPCYSFPYHYPLYASFSSLPSLLVKQKRLLRGREEQGMTNKASIRAGAVVRALASHWCGPVLILSTDDMWAKFVVGSFSAARGSPPGTPVFPSPQKPAPLNSNSTQNARTHITWASGLGDWVTTPHVIELKQLDLIWFDFDQWKFVYIQWHELLLISPSYTQISCTVCSAKSK